MGIKQPDKIYLVWHTDDGESFYFLQYDSLSEAVQEHPNCEVHIARPRLLGRFKIVTKPTRIKKRKTKKVKK